MTERTESGHQALEVFVARQPIFDAEGRVFAYELLYRSGGKDNAFGGGDGAVATSRLIANAYLTIGLERLVGSRRAFINFDRRMLVEDYAEALPPKSAVIEILEDVPADDEVIAACRRLKRGGYSLALDDVTGAGAPPALVELADVVKVDFLLTKPEERRELVRRYAGRRLRLLAEKVETQEEFKAARDWGYSLFQGYFFSRPEIVAGRDIPGFKLNYLRILTEMSNPALDFGRLESIVRCEPSLLHKLLRYINSAHFGLQREVRSVGHALALLGEAEIRRWVSLIALAGLAGNKPEQLVVDAVTRGRLSELLAPLIGQGGRAQELFLMGMFSLLDAVLDQPMEKVLAEVHLAGDVRDTLTGAPGAPPKLSAMLAVARAYEAADWPALEETCNMMRQPLPAIAARYVEAVEWADRIFRE